MDQYDKRMRVLKDQQFEINAIVAPLCHEAPERIWYQRKAAAIAGELSILYDTVDALRSIDARILDLSDAINARTNRDRQRTAGWSSAGKWLAGVGSLLLLLCTQWTPTAWLPVIALCLVTGGLLALRRASASRREVDPDVLAWGDELERLEHQRADILTGRQSPSASSPASALDSSGSKESGTVVSSNGRS